MIDLEELGLAAAALMDTLAEVDNLPEEVRLEEVMLIAAVSWPAENGVGQSVYWRCSSSYPWVQRGLLEIAHKSVDRSGVPYEPEEVEEE
jgi:hypothetical protein